MAALSGGVYLTFSKPYVEKVAALIESGDKVKFDGARGSHKITKTEEIKKFLRAVKAKNENQVVGLLKIGAKYSPLFNGYKWTEIDKGQFTGMGGGSDAKTTAMQEIGSLFAIQKGIENNGFTDQKAFYKKYRKDLLEIYPGMNEVWENTFFEQQKTVQAKVGNTKYGHYSRDDGFMEYITRLASSMYGITKKDTWNPADIWLVSDFSVVKRKLDKAVRDDNTSLQEFNAILRQMFHDREIVGISLKLMSGKTALWELVNLSNEDLFDNDEYNFTYHSSELLLSMKTKTEFDNTDSKLVMGSKKATIKFQIRQNSPGLSNLKIEGTDIGASAARLGKVPLDMATNLFAGAKLESTRWRRWQNYPKNTEEFLANKKTYTDKFKKLLATRKVDLGIRTAQEFEDNMVAVFTSGKAEIANSKLMQLDLLCEIFSITQPKNLNNFLTHLAFLAQKKGTVFGPFAKLY